MDEISKEYVISFFDKKLMRHGDRPEAVGWSSKGQLLRFQAMLDAGDVNNNTVLDFGCGKGDFYGFLKGRGIQVEYSGLDINEKLISLARQKYPDGDFRVFDIDKDVLDKDFDYIFLCGVFNLELAGDDEMIKSTLFTLFRHCRKVLAFNALSSRDPKKDFELHYVSPEELLDFALKNLSPHISVSHDRIPYDFTMYVRRQRVS